MQERSWSPVKDSCTWLLKRQCLGYMYCSFAHNNRNNVPLYFHMGIEPNIWVIVVFVVLSYAM
jgi:hypothetical protein